MAGFEMRRKLPNRIGWVIFRRWGSIPNGVMWTDVMWTTKRADLKRHHGYLDCSAFNPIDKGPITLPDGAWRGATPSESDKGVRCSR